MNEKYFTSYVRCNIDSGESCDARFSIYPNGDLSGLLESYIAYDDFALAAITKNNIADEANMRTEIEDLLSKCAEYSSVVRICQLAKRYKQIPVISHTNNQWEVSNSYGTERGVISNAVYEMTYQIECRPLRNEYRGDMFYFAEYRLGCRSGKGDYCLIQDGHSSKYKTHDEAKRYIDNRYKKYSNLFQCEYPCIPSIYKTYFSFYGILLPHYVLQEDEVK